MFTERLQVLLDEERLRRLQRAAEQRGASVGHLVREAIDLALPVVPAHRRAAAQRLLDRPPLFDALDWESVKAELLDPGARDADEPVG